MKKPKKKINKRKKKLNQKGFSFVEILSVMVIIGIIAMISYGAVNRYIKQQRYKNYEALIKTAQTAADEYIMDHPYADKFTFKELEEANYIDRITDPMDKSKDCRGKIRVRKEQETGKKIDKTYYSINYCCIEFNRTYDSKTKAISNDSRCKADPYDLNLVPLIKVLNVYPVESANNLRNWMVAYGKNPLTGDKKIDVDSVSLDAFNSNPGAYLKENGSWKYHEVVFGFWDCNASKDLSANAASMVNTYLNEGGAAIFGHDTLTKNGCGNHTNFNSLASHVCLDLHSGVSWSKSKKVKIVHKGIFTEFPWNIGTEGTVLEIPESHVYGQEAKGQVWLTFEGMNDSNEANIIYLSTCGNNAFIQTGHSNGSATDQEKKILANIIFYAVGNQYAEKED